jgi:hypothetical protein
MSVRTYPRGDPDPSGPTLAPVAQGIGLYLEDEGGSSPDFRIWLFVASGVLLLGALSLGLRLLLRLFLSL